MTPQRLTDEEIEKLRSLIPVADVLREEAEYQAAWRLVVHTWKRVVIGIGAAVAFVIVTRDQIRIIWDWIVK